MSVAKIAKWFGPYSFSFCLTFSQLREQEPFEDLTKDLKNPPTLSSFSNFKCWPTLTFTFTEFTYPWTTHAKLVQFYIDIINFVFFLE